LNVGALRIPAGIWLNPSLHPHPIRSPLQSRWRFLATTANGQLAFGTYQWDETTRENVSGGLDVLTIRSARVAEVTAFLTADLTRFGLPAQIRS
jgi:hypothetical protein